MDFKAPLELWNPLSKAVPRIFHGSGWHSKHSCPQDQANMHRSRVWQIVLISNTALWYLHKIYEKWLNKILQHLFLQKYLNLPTRISAYCMYWLLIPYFLLQYQAGRRRTFIHMLLNTASRSNHFCATKMLSRVCSLTAYICKLIILVKWRN